jgi:hypothetical protein
MNIDANLKNVLDRWIKLARQMCGRENLVERKRMEDEVLMFFAGLGLARIEEPTSATPIWVAEQSNAVDSYIGDNFFSVFERYFAEGRNFLPSLSIMVADIVERIRSSRPRPDEQTENEVMLWLSGVHLAQLIPDVRAGALIWAPFDDLVRYFASAEWRASIRVRRPGQLSFSSSTQLGGLVCETRVDGPLRAIIEAYREMEGVDPADKASDFGLLLAMETRGEAIAYRDFDGGLAWKSSKAFRLEAPKPIQ